MMHQSLIFPQKRKVDLKSRVAEEKENCETIISGISKGTELTWYEGNAPALKSGRKNYPYSPGYCCIGEVKEDGDGVYKKGDVLLSMQTHQSHFSSDSNRPTIRLPEENDYTKYLIVPLMSTAVHAIHQAGVSIGDKCLIVGGGGLAYCLFKALNSMGCSTTVIGGRWNAENVHKYDDIPSQTYDVVFEASGNVSRVNLCEKLVGSRGKIILTGLYTEQLTIDNELLFAKEISFIASRSNGTVNSLNDYIRHNAKSNFITAYELVKSLEFKEVNFWSYAPEEYGDSLSNRKFDMLTFEYLKWKSF